MQTLQEWANYYQRMKVWVFPFSLEEVAWKFWKDKKDADYLALFKTWDWDGESGLKLVVGKKGIRMIELSDREQLSEVLSLLELPDDYPWIIDSVQGLGIVVDTPSATHSVFGLGNKSNSYCRLLWEGYYVLPSIHVSQYFYKNRMPTDHPSQVLDSLFVNCLNYLKLL